MVSPVEMPKPGVTVEECLLVRWLRQPGEQVSSGEVIAEIETDKATFEVSAPAGGQLLARFFEEGELVPVYTNLCVIGEAGEDIEKYRPAKASPAAAAASAPATAPEARQEKASAPALASPAAGNGEQFLSPRARRFAASHRVETSGIAGSGPGGRVLEADLKRAFFERPRISPLASQYLSEGYERRGPGTGAGGMLRAADLASPPVAVGGIRERIARRMRESLSSTAQYTLHSSAGAAGLLALRARIKARGFQPDVNLNEMVAFCAVKALLRHPELNAEFIGNRIYRHEHIHLGFACDTPKGLIVPVVKNCQAMPLAELAARIKELSRQAVEGGLSPDDLSGGTFTMSNLGSLGIEAFTPIVNPPQVAILGVNAIRIEPVRRGGSIEFADRIGFSLTADHQVIDGAPGARYLVTLRECIENVEALAGLEV